MGWLFFSLFSAMALGALWYYARLSLSGLSLIGAAVLLAATGYALQGSPMLEASPAVPANNEANAISDPEMRHAMYGRFDGNDALLNTADAFNANHNSSYSIGLLTNTLKKYPENSLLWVGLGNAYLAQTGGILSPAATYCFDKSEVLAPGSPGAAYFKGLALMQSGNREGGLALIRNLYQHTPSNASYRPLLEKRIGQLEMMSHQQI